jgi:hypothetical protein
MKHLLSLIAWLLLLIVSGSFITQKKKTKLFLPGNKSEWYTWLEKSGKNNDPKKVFRFEGNILHVSGEEFGYICTEKKYSNFKLTFQFKWGEKKFSPRENEKRDAGVLYLANHYKGDKIWPRSFEFQIQEGDCGDFWMTDSTTIMYKGQITPSERWHREIKYSDTEKPNGQWNKVEIIISNGKITHLLNGVIVNEGTDPSIKEGYIILQSEGAEIYYRNTELELLK